jgi:hypothetical protein
LQDVNFDLHILERTVGISENALAVYRTGRRTATEAGLVAQGTETRMGNIASKFENRNLVDIAMMDYNLELQNLTDPARYRILGPKGYEFRSTDREGILHKGSFDVKPIGTLMFGNKQMKDNKFLQTASLVVGNPMMAQSSDLTAILRELWTRAEVKDPDRFIRDISATDYVIPPEMENEMILGIGQHLKPGNNDNDEEHIRSHTDFMERGDYPKEYKPVFEEHISLHEQRAAQMKSGGGANIPTAPENILGQQFQNFGGLRVPGEGSPEGMTPGPGELALGGGAGAQGQG